MRYIFPGHPKIIHRDIKSANILLEEDFEAKATSILFLCQDSLNFVFLPIRMLSINLLNTCIQVADFGLARLNDTSQSHVSTRVMGTFG